MPWSTLVRLVSSRRGRGGGRSRGTTVFDRPALAFRRVVSLAVHGALIVAAFYLAFALRFDFDPPPAFFMWFLQSLPLVVVSKLSLIAWFRVEAGIWRYAGMRDLLLITKAVTFGSAIFAILDILLIGHGFPRSVVILDWVLSVALIGGPRLVLRAFHESRRRTTDSGRRAIIVGAGYAGERLLHEIQNSQSPSYTIAGFVDDDPRKRGRRLHDVEVLGAIDELPLLCQQFRVAVILVAIPSASREQQARIISACRESGAVYKTVPALEDLLLGRASISDVREVRSASLLGREPIRLDIQRLRGELCGKRVLVSGAAGSIGSELCRQLAGFEPELLILFDRAESPLHSIDLELRRAYPGVKLAVVIGDLLDKVRVEELFSRHAPEIVYHAAAYKHVPMMEDHPVEAIRNNVLGTEILAHVALGASVVKFALISTDKAVKPVSIMGMTKRVGEDLLLSLMHSGRTTFVSVRFGNVLGSEGSVVPLFKRQIADGGPVTVTDPEMSRYFMLPSEAAQLVLQAGSMGRGGEVFLLDMGQPVRIMDLAHNLIRLSGLEPGRDIAIEVIGLRPGERLSEELVTQQEKKLPSDHEKIFVVQSSPLDDIRFGKQLEELRSSVQERNTVRAVELLRVMAARE